MVGDFDGDGVVDSIKGDLKQLYLSDSTYSETTDLIEDIHLLEDTTTHQSVPAIKYHYDANGNLLETEDIRGNVIALTYDKLGRKIAMDDPDMGNWTYQYDGLGQMTLQIDAKGQKSYQHYDILGRVTLSSEDSITVVNTYDQGHNAKGKLSNTSAGNNYSRDQVYDDYGRIIKTTIGLDSDYVISVVYDTKGRVKSRHWPTGFALTMNYKSNGYLKNVTGSDGVKYIEIKTMDAFGNMIGYTYGNNIATTLSYDDLGRLTSIISGEDGIVQDKKYTFDKIGNILTRSDGNLDHVETFKYDGWNRLTENKLIGWTSQWKGVNYTNTQRVHYDVLGNITFKSDVGHYKYNKSPHAVSSVSGVKNYTYTYDANGNQISGAGRSIAYTSFNKISRLEVIKDDEMMFHFGKKLVSVNLIYFDLLYVLVQKERSIRRKNRIHAIVKLWWSICDELGSA